MPADSSVLTASIYQIHISYYLSLSHSPAGFLQMKYTKGLT